MGARLKLNLKTALSCILYYSGVLRLLKRVLLRNRAVVLMYHRVLSEGERSGSFSHPGIIVGKEVFENQMRFLKREFNVIGEDEFNSHFADKKAFKHGTCLVTFDDGWRDNAANAFPTLKGYGIPALVFLTEGYIGSNGMFWQERMTAVLSALCRESTEDNGLLARYGLNGPLDRANTLPAIKKFIESQKRRAPAEIEKTMDEISSSLTSHPGTGPDNFLDWAAVREMSSCGISFGSHGVTHRLLTRIAPAEAEAEIRDSRKSIAGKTGKTPLSFSYPNGDHDDRTVELVEKNGYAAAFTTMRGFVKHTDDPFRLKRVNIHNDAAVTTPLFFCRILGIL